VCVDVLPRSGNQEVTDGEERREMYLIIKCNGVPEDDVTNHVDTRKAVGEDIER
jgi:hypothetical protein